MAIPVPLILGAATELIKLGADIFDLYSKGATQDEINERWAANQPKIAAANALWEASKGPQT